MQIDNRQPYDDARPNLQRSCGCRQTILRVVPLQLDLIERTAKGAERQIGLLGQEFRLLQYMMLRGDQLLSRSTLLEGYGSFRRQLSLTFTLATFCHKVDGPSEIRMIYNVRGRGSILVTPPGT